MTDIGLVGAALAVVAITWLLPGIFGLLGGFLLISLLIAILDLTTGNLLISTVLIATNLSRTFYWFNQIHWRAVLLSTTGATAAFLMIVASGVCSTKAWIFIIIGGVPL